VQSLTVVSLKFDQSLTVKLLLVGVWIGVRGRALLHSHAGEQVLSLWLQGKCHEFRWAV
jgi:hypothetical protein